MPQLFLFNKPYLVLCQFSAAEGRPTLANYLHVPHVYPAGRLDHDSEGLLALTDLGPLQHAISDPQHRLAKTYWAQVEGLPSEQALDQLRRGVDIKDGPTRPAHIELLPEPAIWPRTPPIRARKSIPTTWIALTIREGRNRQVRRMTAAVGLPTLRLIRTAIGPWQLGDLQPGAWRAVDVPSNWRSVLR